MTIFDFVGKPITVGCCVVYPKRRGSKMWLAMLHVDNIVQNGDVFILTGRDKTGKGTRTKNIQNCIVVEAKSP